MSDADRERWDARHERGGRRVPGPSVWLERVAWALEGCESVVDLACGSGEDVHWLVAQGFRAVGLDVSPVAVTLAGRGDGEFSVVDLDDWEPAATWDAVLTMHYLDRTLWPRIRRAVRPGGVFVGEVLVEGTPFGRAFQAQEGELLRAFSDWRVMAWEERALPDGRVVARIAARRPV